MGQASAILTAMALVGQEVSETETGAVRGLFTLFGAIGILLATKIGGLLFDGWMPGAPFVITGLANGGVFKLQRWRWLVWVYIVVYIAMREYGSFSPAAGHRSLNQK
ncbi:MAG: hypothetical protein CM1200mP41_39170 [Gammaproteobacteria bacterium]|nr:MAG: hypothetical protein CM1200mP41_39170 [Gammaproteobacteria bacterium]